MNEDELKILLEIESLLRQDKDTLLMEIAGSLRKLFR